MIIHAPAKINLGLRILGKRTDGFHELETIFASVGLFDELEFKTRTDQKIKLQIRDTRYEIRDTPLKKNLIYLATQELRKLTKKKMGISIHLIKNIPIKAGLGGGSSDAATTLIALNKLWKLKLSPKELEKIGAKLGSDVPFFIRGGIQKGGGRGEILRPIKLPKNFPRFILLVIPKKIKINTTWAYQKYSAQTQKIYQCQLPTPFANDFECVAFEKYPELTKIKIKLMEIGAKYATISGSGSAMYGLFKKTPKKINQLKKFGEIYLSKIRE